MASPLTTLPPEIRTKCRFAVFPHTGSFSDHCAGPAAITVSNTPYWASAGDFSGIRSKSGSGDALVAANEAKLNPADGITFFWLWGHVRHSAATTTEWIFRKTNQYACYFNTAEGLIYYDFNTTSLVYAAGSGVEDAQTVALRLTPGEKPDGFLDGVGPTVSASTQTLPVAANDLDIFGRSAAGASSSISATFGAFLILDYLSDDEIASIHTAATKWRSVDRRWPPGGAYFAEPFASNPRAPTFRDSISAARVSLANEVSGTLSNTEYTVVTGTWQVDEETDGTRYANCIGNGQLFARDLGADTQTTNLFDADGATLTKTTQGVQIDAVAGDRLRRVVLTV